MDWRWSEVDALEKQEKWNEAKSLLTKEWQQNPTDLKRTIRLGFFCWYVLVEHFPLGTTDIDLRELDTLLKKITDYGLANFKTNEDFLWCFGYMIALFPFYFGEDEYWEAKGFSMLKRAYERCPDEIVYRYTYLSMHPNTYENQKDEYHQLQAVLKERFQGEGLVSDYFKSIWHRWQGS
jgi:hypothetical protein